MSIVPRSAVAPLRSETKCRTQWKYFKLSEILACRLSNAMRPTTCIAAATPTRSQSGFGRNSCHSANWNQKGPQNMLCVGTPKPPRVSSVRLWRKKKEVFSTTDCLLLRISLKPVIMYGPLGYCHGQVQATSDLVSTQVGTCRWKSSDSKDG